MKSTKRRRNASLVAEMLFCMMILLAGMGSIVVLIYTSQSNYNWENQFHPGLATYVAQNAYMMYATDSITLCNARIMARNIRRLGTPSSIPIVVLVSSNVPITMHEFLIEADIIPITVPSWRQVTAKGRNSIWRDSLTKLLVFEERGYQRIIYIDTDAWIHRNLDHLFEFDLSNGKLWAPPAYYITPQPYFASTLMVFEPSNERLMLLLGALENPPKDDYFDMDVLNDAWENVQYLPPHYVVLNSDLNSQRTFGFSNVTERIKHTYIHHFSSKANGNYGKPWEMKHEIKLRTKRGNHPQFYELFNAYWTSFDNECGWFHSKSINTR